MDIVLGLLLIAALSLYVLKVITSRKQLDKYKGIVSIDKEIAKKEKEYKKLNDKMQKLDTDYNKNKDKLNTEYQRKRDIYEQLLKEISILEESLEFTTYGIYKPHFDFDTSEEYKENINEIQNQQKLLIKDEQAIVCKTEWEVSGSKKEGKKMTKRNMKLMLKAFNSECDTAILKVKWNNVNKMDARIQKTFDAINTLGETNYINITHKYFGLKIDELHLAHEYQEKKYEEKEEQRRIREQMREEEKVQREIEKTLEKAENEENMYNKALEKAKIEIETAKGKELEKLNGQMTKLQEQLREAHEKNERAKSRAQMTKLGHVYVISNIGSFGENVYKVGMTRRLDPMDRVKELGDASVPFSFDVHAIIYSENAPELESKLHKMLDKNRLNMINSRKEFFRINLNQIESFVHNTHNKFEFTKVAEAKEYRETMALVENANKNVESNSFPATL